jgi:putative membrane protein
MMKDEFKAIFKNKKLLIPILAVLFIPVLYSGMFLWAFWDPYAGLPDLPVAVVNEDLGADYDGEPLKLGEDFVDKLKESQEFKFDFVDTETAFNDLKAEKYYMIVKIPKNFSENATTLLEEHPQKLELTYIPNEGYNFLSAQIGDTAMQRIKASLSEKIIETYSETMFDRITEMADGVVSASDGASKLDDGVSSLNNGVKELNKGTKELSDGSQQLKDHLFVLAEKSIEFNNGARKLQSGSRELSGGLSQLEDGLGLLAEGQNQLANGSSQLASGAKQLSTSMTDWKQGADQAAIGASQVNQGIQSLEQQIQQLLAVMPSLPADKKIAIEQALAQLNQGSSQVAQGVSQLSTSAGQLSQGTLTLAEKTNELTDGIQTVKQKLDESKAGVQKLSSGAKQLADGTTELEQGATAFVDGTSKLADGSEQLAEGTNKLTKGTTELTDGTAQLKDGSLELASKLHDGAEKVSSLDVNEETYNMMAQPVVVKDEKVNEVPNYGTGFAPYFLSLGLFVGALLLSIVFPLREPASTPKNGFHWFLSKFGVLVGVGIIQALISVAVLLFGLGIEVQSVPLFIVFSIITSLSFITLIQFLVSSFGDPGRFIAIVILILQLTTSAGTFPLELIPSALQPFNAFLPMTYTVSGLKAVISSGDFSFMWHNAAILAAFISVFITGSIVYFTIKHKRNFRTVVEESTGMVQ